MHSVRIDPDHRYWIPDGTAPTGSRQVPGYSEICAAIGVTKPNPFYTEDGRERGSAVHEWASFIAQGKITKADPDGRIKARVDQFRRFIRDTRFVLAGTETPMYDPVAGFACTPDLWGSIGVWSWVIDVKTGGKQKSHALQTSAQSVALKANGFRAQKRGVAYLKDGNYRLIDHANPEDESNWRAIVAGYHAMHPEQRAVFSSEEFPLRNEVFKTLTDAQRRTVINAHSARSHYL